MRFQVGDRVRLSDEGLRGLRQMALAARQGTVRILTTRSSGVATLYVRWDGRVSDAGYHESCLELVERPR